LETLSDPWTFEAWQNSIERAGERQFRHILNFWCFPDSFERITTSSQKRMIVSAFAATPSTNVEQLSDIEIDKTLFEIRNRLREERGIDNFDFYLPNIRAEWWTEKSSTWLLSWNPSEGKWPEFDSDRAQTARGEPVTRRWRCGNSAAKPGDEFYLVRTGDEKRGIIAAGSVVSAPYEAPHFDPS